MKKQLLLLFTTVFAVCQLQAQTGRVWSAHNDSSGKMNTDKGVARQSFPKEFKLYDLDINPLRQALFSVNGNVAAKHNAIISLPNADGQIEEFEVYEASNFEPDLQARFPQIRAYSGKGITDKYATLKLSISPQGIQTMVFRTDKENEFIEPYSQDHTVYAVFKSHRERGQLSWTCSTDDKKLVLDVNSQLPSNTNKSSAGQLKTMRLAQSCNGEYAAYFGASTAGNAADQLLVLAAFNATLTRCNGVYEKDLALHLNLVGSTTNVIYYNSATDPYTTLANWNKQLQQTLSSKLTGPATTLAANNAAYDIGHMFGASGGGGNAGCIGCVCVDDTAAANDLNKGAGITSPADGIPQGDNFDIDYVVHEVGHQLGGNHTFSNSNEGAGVSKEVGSGVTIMGYAGITSQDIAPHSIDIYHETTIAQIQANLAGKTCPVTTSLAGNNETPVANAGADYTIPKSTPFILTGSATDANAGDALTYCWEQNDDGGAQTAANSVASITKPVGPNWRSWSPTASPSRYLPLITTVIANSQTTAGTGNDGINVEALSSVARTLNFRLTVRDNVPYSSTAPIKVGQTSFDDMVVTVDGTAGPFIVSAPDTAVSWTVGTNQLVTWAVAGTTANGVNCNYVDIFLSTDGGFTYPILLASKVPNDGSETITVPNNVGNANRIMVKGNNHIFYDISNTNFTIAAPVSTFSASFSGTAGEQNKAACQGTNVSYNITYKNLGGFSGTTTFSATGNPAGSTVSFAPSSTNVDGTVVMTISNTNASTAGVYPIVVSATSGATTKTVPFYLELFNSNFGSMSLTTPVNSAVGQVTSVNLTWAANSNATSYDVQVATDNAFTSIIRSGNTTATSYSVTGLSQATDYYWRVLPKNSSCSGTYSAGYKFTTGVITCPGSVSSTNIPLTITATGASTINSTLNIPAGGTIADVNITMNVAHTWINDLTAILISPLGTQVQLYAQPCSYADIENITATFDDAGAPVICGTNPGISGTVQPIQLLSAFNGENSTGTWTLRITDGFDQDGGTLNSWSLNVCTVQPLHVEENQFQDFVLYPNPNNGSFNVKFTSNSTNNIKINVYDMRGREVYDKSFSNTGAFNQNINLDKVQSGIYLISIVDGAKKTVKRIVVE